MRFNVKKIWKRRSPPKPKLESLMMSELRLVVSDDVMRDIRNAVRNLRSREQVVRIVTDILENSGLDLRIDPSATEMKFILSEAFRIADIYNDDAVDDPACVG